jgi:hypothetical protein
MKNATKTTALFLFVFFTLVALPTQASLVRIQPVTQLSCIPPNATLTGQSSGYVSFAWDAVLGASYRVWYYRQEDHYTSSVTTTGNTYISFSSLPAGTYKFYFVTDCGNELSQSTIIDDIVIL